MYSRIQAMKEKGFSIRQVSRVIRVSRNTIKKYWEMKPDEYAAAYETVNRMTALMAYEAVVLKCERQLLTLECYGNWIFQGRSGSSISIFPGFRSMLGNASKRYFRYSKGFRPFSFADSTML